MRPTSTYKSSVLSQSDRCSAIAGSRIFSEEKKNRHGS